jgi:hypothetical protein
MEKDTFDVLILIGRPASGKSEIIDHLTHASPDARRRRFHVADIDVLDDFPLLWAWFEEDHILAERFRKPRLHTDGDGYFKYPYLWNVLIARLSLAYDKRLRDDPARHDDTTTVVEFSRGSEHGGYVGAFQHLAGDLLSRAAVLYVRVPFEESLRKNRRRFNPDRPDSILEHGLPDEKMERLYRDDDWNAFSGAKDWGHLTVQGIDVPYAVFPNEDDVTSGPPELLAVRLEEVLGRLWDLRRS